MKRIVSFFLAIVLVLPLSLGCFTANQEAESAADMLYELGLFQGKGTDADGRPDYALDDVPTRQEAVTMLVRLLGKESEAKSGSWTIPFTDVAAWAAPYVGYAYANGLTTGVSASAFDGGSAVTAAQYITFVLRALGYRSGTDFQWNTSWELSDRLGITDGRYRAGAAQFLRADVALISVGYNTYGHPTPEALARYAAHGVAVLRTDEQGNIVLRMDETDHGETENR